MIWFISNDTVTVSDCESVSLIGVMMTCCAHLFGKEDENTVVTFLHKAICPQWFESSVLLLLFVVTWRTLALTQNSDSTQ